MLETKYGLKYPMPHVLVHIVDNSAYTGDLPVVIADDPSMYGTLVVSGMPMGEDNRVIGISRSDILNVAYGLNRISSSDIEKYGQTITYPVSLIDQGAPIQLLRVTPADATYAYSCVTIEWRWDPDGPEPTMHVRFNTARLNNDRDLQQYKNKDRLAAAIIKSATADNVEDSEGNKWTRRAFMVNISAGRGSAYNNFTTAINMTIQGKKPSNVRYLFSTIDTTINSTVEQFYASLINENNRREDYIDPVNVVIKKRAPGSSVVVPYLNEAAVRELYNEYYARFTELMEDNDDDIIITDAINKAYRSLSINIFDPIFGLYLWEGTDETQKLPFFQVDMRSADVPELNETNRICYNSSEVSDPSVDQTKYEVTKIADKLLDVTAGVAMNGKTYNTYIGDLYLYSGLASLNNPYIYVVASINQFTGAVTTVRTNQLVSPNSPSETSRLATIIVADNIDSFYAQLTASVTKQYVKDGESVAWRNQTNEDGTWDLFYIVPGTYNFVRNGGTLQTSTAAPYVKQYTITNYNFIKWTDIPNVGNLIGFDENDAAYNRAGATVINKTVAWLESGAADPTAKANAPVYVNGEYTETSFYVVTNRTKAGIMKYGAPQSKVVPLTNDVIGTQFDAIKCTPNNSTPYKLYDAGSDGMLHVTSTVDLTAYNGAKIGMYMPTADGEQSLVLFEPAKAEGTNKYDLKIFKNGEVTATFHNGLPTSGGLKMFLARNVYRGYYNASKFYEDSEHTTEIPANENDLYYDLGGTAKWYKYANNAYATVNDIVAATESIQIMRWYEQASGTGAWIAISGTDATVPGKTDAQFTKMLQSDFEQIIDERCADDITRYSVTGTLGSLFRIQQLTIDVKKNYYSSEYGINLTSQGGGVKLEDGSTGFFDEDISTIEFKWKYSQLLCAAYRGQIDPRILSPVRTPAKYLFDGATNTIVGQMILPTMAYSAADLVAASTVFTEDEKDEVLFNPDIVKGWSGDADIDVKQAMYDLMDHRIYQGIPEDKRPIGPGSGLSLHLDSGYTDTTTATAINNSFKKRFDNPNASWDIGGYVSTADGITYTFTKKIVDSLIAHCKTYTVNKPFTNLYTQIRKEEYSSYFPDIDTTDWEYRALMYNSGGNAWLPDVNGVLMRRSQRTLMRGSDTSDLIQESNMRTLSQLCYLLQNKLEEKLFEYNDDSVLRTMSDEVNNMFSNWSGNLVESLNITFDRDINPLDGGELVVCYVDVVFRGINLRIPVIVNVNRREITT
jgi:hypothetical protein